MSRLPKVALLALLAVIATPHGASAVTVRPTNSAPVADAGDPYTVPEGGTVALDASRSSDRDGNIDAIRWDLDGDGQYDAAGLHPVFSAAGLDGPSTVTVRLQVCDTMLACSTDSEAVHVVNVAPQVDLAADVTVYRNDPVLLSGSFTDPGGALDNPYAFAWSGAAPLRGATGSTTYGTTLTQPITYPVEGTYSAALTVTDKDGAAGSDTATVTVLNWPPVCSAAAPSVGELWPPNHTFVPVAITGVTDAEDDALTVTITGIRQDEQVDERGSGNTGPDASGVGTAVAQLRPERSGRGDGRVYHLAFSAADGHGGSCSGATAVTVPHDQRGVGAVDQGPLYDSTVG